MCRAGCKQVGWAFISRYDEWDRTRRQCCFVVLTTKVSEEILEDRDDPQQVDGRDLFAILLHPMASEEP